MLRTGIYNVVTDGFRWRHLIFYERDTPLNQVDMNLIIQDMDKAKSAFALYNTDSGGFHVMGLTPVSTIVWAYGFKDLDQNLKGNHSGHVLRCNLKPHEHQELVMLHGTHDYTLCDQIYHMVRRKFKLVDNYYFNRSVLVEKWKSMFCIYGDKGVSVRMPTFKRIDKGHETPTPVKEKPFGFTMPSGEIINGKAE